MTTRRRPAALLLRAFVVVLSTCGAAYAQTPGAGQPAPLRDPQAEADYQRGVQAFRDRRYGDARSAFEASVRREPAATNLFGYAQACRNSGRYVDAIAAFERFLATPVGPAEAQLRTDMRDQLVQLRRSLATLTLEVEPPRASVHLDGRALGSAGGVQSIDPGAHVVEVSAEGHQPERREVTVDAGGQLVLHVSLRAVASSRGHLVVEPDVASASVSVDGRAIGRGRAEVDVPLGDHLVEINAAGFQPYRRPVHMDGPGTVRVTASLTRRGLPGWVLPVSIVGGAALIGGAIALGVVLSSDGGNGLPSDLRVIATAEGIRVAPWAGTGGAP